ncbi:DUF4390 domain-containing protein [Sedimenticola thiotaurini]|uniref:DUF4390 domain-containing protein n=1 Tax=Sedimenticola thiotaurini TaxID=1543721 RepID=A0A0F7JWV3_9GAMM|nr:DUF4390 domain-containing protein [Sedimenticola thiotaurini]AKH21006.1 hypothetical protein AAY24_12325 [Sedimenticola thiotaurini]
MSGFQAINRHWKQGARRGLWLSLLLFLLVSAGSSQAAGFSVEGLKTRKVEGVYLMDADIHYQFSDQALEALDSGVPLTLEVHTQLRREGAWIWEADLLDVRLRYRILHQALHGLYQVTDIANGTQQYFATRKAAFTALGRIRDVQLIEAKKLQQGETYRLSLKSSLDIEALPLPLRPLAYLSPAWNLSSEWSLWRLQP